MLSLDESYECCRRITRRAGSSFHFAFGLLPREQCDAMYALYAFFRLTDDLADDHGQSLDALKAWRNQLQSALSNDCTHDIHPALCDTVRRYHIPPQYLLDVIDGCESDCQSVEYFTFEQLQPYLYRVASVVGLCCLRVWGLNNGVSWNDAEPLAVASGYAFQLTNILRDTREDALAGRCYWPREELTRFGIQPEDFLKAEFAKHPSFQAFCDFQLERTRGYYRSSQRLQDLLPGPGRRMFRLMHRSYWRLLDRIDAQRDLILSKRITVPKWRKAIWYIKAKLAG